MAAENGGGRRQRRSHRRFFFKIDYFNTLASYNESSQEMCAINPDYKIILSNNFHNFTSARSAESNILINNNIKFYANSESFLNFFDKDNSFHLVKLNIGELKFNDAIQKLDKLCFENNLIEDSNFSDLNFTIQSGALLL